jgi:hypothetical protein
MFTRIFEPEAAPKEGDLYKIIKLHGASFEIRYGYYEEIDRHNEPMGIYPDFLKVPVYTDDGFPFVTHMQSPCDHYMKKGKDADKDCSTCAYMEQGDELIGICKCKKNQKLTQNN